MAVQEVRTYIAGINSISTERLIDRATPGFIFREHLARYTSTLGHVAGKNVLDIACGTGYGSDYIMRKAKPKSIVAADIDPDALRYARLRYKHPNIEFVQADACARWTDRKFDTIISFETIEHVPRPDVFLHQMISMLEPDGSLFVSSPVRRVGALSDAPANPFHIREWTIDEFQALLNLFFNEVRLSGQSFSLLRKRGPIRIPGRFIRKMAKPVHLESPFFEALIYDVLPLEIVPVKYQAGPPTAMIAHCRGPKQNVDADLALRLAMG